MRDGRIFARDARLRGIHPSDTPHIYLSPMAPWHEGPLVGLDFETTGVNPSSDLPVQVAVVACDGRGNRSSEVWLVDPGVEIPEAAVAIHGISTETARAEGRSLLESAHSLHRRLREATLEEVPIVAMNASFDVTIATHLFSRAGLAALEWRLVIDPLVIDRRMDKYRKGKRRLDALCAHYGVGLEGAHDAGKDAAAAVDLAREIGRRFPEAAVLHPEELTVLEVAWHRAWAADYDNWCRREGRPGLGAEEFNWPVREPALPPAGVLQPASESSTMSMSASLERGLTTASRMAALP